MQIGSSCPSASHEGSPVELEPVSSSPIVVLPLPELPLELSIAPLLLSASPPVPPSGWHTTAGGSITHPWLDSAQRLQCGRPV